MNAPSQTDLLIVGGGPAGVSAALTAASLGMRTTLVEAERIGSKLYAIGALDNLAGGWTNGPQLAEALTADMERLEATGACTVVLGRAVSVGADEQEAQVLLADGRDLRAAAVVVATGVSTMGIADVDWVDAPGLSPLAPLWRTMPKALQECGRIVVVGADRPLGTWLRAHPEADVSLHVLHPESDRYKTEEVADDPRVHLEETTHATVVPIPGGVRVAAQRADGRVHTFAADVVLMNAGSKPAGLAGLYSDTDGYCPADAQDRRIMIAGDLKSARMQRIAIAMGDGQRCALMPYYERALLPSREGTDS
ncbi:MULTISPECIES: FAD-dependent oxidoreductase [Streptomyces]|uniref:Putative oxidoreductase n=1 Tax=Streptomyces zinciresistens K42 TaxID=700597 RepID=G2G761_9ACTN|nr:MULTISPECIES: FAD-dependent oxidoreductase [Streptomyces]EGX60602.1 putative oxidoreductase [Streptomyces zinciresistens K42]MDT9695920.1 FAD-dependent oxidoreductase [Streptomyces sp. P17]